MPKIRIAINGFGRIGRNTLKAAYDHFNLKNVEFVAINDLMEPEGLAKLLAFDSVYGKWNHKISFDKKHLIVDGHKIVCVSEKEPANLPWKEIGVDVVLECTGRFTKAETAKLHLDAGAKKVIVSAPVKEGVPTYIFGVNSKKYKGEKLINNGSCTTNCVAPVINVVKEHLGVKKVMMTTTHAVTAQQSIVDGPPPAEKKDDFRRARAALNNMIPTSSGAAIAVTSTMPDLTGLFDGAAIRVPIICVSIADFTFLLKKKTTVEAVQKIFKKAAAGSHRGVIEASEEPLVSSDLIGNPYSAIVDLELTKVVDGDMLKVMAWYDNEWGYSCRLIEMAEMIGRK